MIRVNRFARITLPIARATKGPVHGTTDFSQISITEPRDFFCFADVLAGFFLLISAKESGQENSPIKSLKAVTSLN